MLEFRLKFNLFWQTEHLGLLPKGIVRSKLKIHIFNLKSFQKLYDFLSSAEHKARYFEVDVSTVFVLHWKIMGSKRMLDLHKKTKNIFLKNHSASAIIILLLFRHLMLLEDSAFRFPAGEHSFTPAVAKWFVCLCPIPHMGPSSPFWSHLPPCPVCECCALVSVRGLLLLTETGENKETMYFPHWSIK